MKEELFIGTFTIILLFNVFVVVANPTQSSLLNIDLTNILVTIVGIVCVGGAVSIILGETVIKIIFSILVLFNVMFQVNISGFTIGLGLINSMFAIFPYGSDTLNLGFITVSILSLVTFVSAMLLVVEST